jgi:hypothetical protein
MEQSPELETYEEPHEWMYEPGLFEFVEQGADAEDLPESLLDRSSASRGSPKLQRMLDWLRGSQLDSVLCEHQPIWVPIIEAWPAEGGSFEFTYEASSEVDRNAEVKVLAVGGLGGSSSRRVSKAIRWLPQTTGRALYIRAFVTIRRYALVTGERVDRVDVDCSGVTGEYRHAELAAASHPFAGRNMAEADIKADGYAINDIQRCADVTDPTQFTAGLLAARTWSFGPDLDIPLLQTGLKLQVDMQHAESFEATFTLPGGHDYAFCTRVGESPVAPVCVSLHQDE